PKGRKGTGNERSNQVRGTKSDQLSVGTDRMSKASSILLSSDDGIQEASNSDQTRGKTAVRRWLESDDKGNLHGSRGSGSDKLEIAVGKGELDEAVSCADGYSTEDINAALIPSNLTRDV